MFIDEVQECKEYEKAVSSLYLKKNLDIYLTGSNAYMLSGELATKLTARYIKIDMLPLSFAEYSEAVATTDKRDRFSQFMNMGAFPYAARLIYNSLANSQYLEGIYNTVLVKDIMTRKKLTDSYLFYKVQRYDIKGKTHLKSESKYYICDIGLRNMILGTQGKDIGHQIENIVYLELLRRGYRVNIGKSGRGKEVDFVAVRDKQTEYYQVSASVLDENTLERELSSFRPIRDNYPKFLITLDDFTVDHNGIRQLNLIDWLLSW